MTEVPDRGGCPPTVVVAPPDLPFPARLVDSLDAAQDEPLLLLAHELSFGAAVEAMTDPRCRGVVSRSPVVHDHARKILAEAGKTVLVCADAPDAGALVQVDEHGLVVLDRLAVQRSVICSSATMDDGLFGAWGIRDIGYLRLKFLLFDLLHRDPAAMHDDARVESHLDAALKLTCTGGWRRIRVVLSDPSSAELIGLGVRATAEPNPQLGCRGPRAAAAWDRELRVIDRVARAHPDIRFQVCVPFVSGLEEYRAVHHQVASAVGDCVEVGFTLEIPSMWVDLRRVLGECRPDFVVVGISDLFALLGGVDRDNPRLAIDDGTPIHDQVLRTIFETLGEHDVPVGFAGDLTRYPEARAVVVAKHTELMSTHSSRSLAHMARIAAGLP